jgi:hypothetical protein
MTRSHSKPCCSTTQSASAKQGQTPALPAERLVAPGSNGSIGSVEDCESSAVVCASAPASSASVSARSDCASGSALSDHGVKRVRAMVQGRHLDRCRPAPPPMPAFTVRMPGAARNHPALGRVRLQEVGMPHAHPTGAGIVDSRGPRGCRHRAYRRFLGFRPLPRSKQGKAVCRSNGT